MNLDKELLYDLYTNIMSSGNKPIYIRDLNYKHHISSAIHIETQNCKNSTFTYKYLNIFF